MAKAKRNAVAKAVSDLISSKQQVTGITFVSINDKPLPKTKIARPLTAQEQADWDLGYNVGAMEAEFEQGVIDALKVATGKRRPMIRQGYVAGYMSAPRYIRGHYVWPTQKQGENRFDNTLAPKHAPAASSRQAAANATKAKRGKGAGRKEKTGAKVTSISAREGRMELALNELLAQFKSEQQSATGDELATLGTWAAIARKALRK